MRNLQKAIQKNGRNVVFPDFTTIQTVTFVADENSKWDKSFFSGLLKPEIEAIIVQSFARKRETDESGLNLYDDDLNWYGAPKRKWFQNANLRETDILINLTNGMNNGIEYICAVSNAKFKISKKQVLNLYDLIVLTNNEDNTLLINEVVRILRNLKSIH